MMLVLFTSTSEKGKMLSHQIIYDLQFLQVTLNKQSRQNCSVCLRASPNQMEVLKHLLCGKYNRNICVSKTASKDCKWL